MDDGIEFDDFKDILDDVQPDTKLKKEESNVSSNSGYHNNQAPPEKIEIQLEKAQEGFMGGDW